MKKINFVNNQAPAINAANLNQMQNNFEDAIEVTGKVSKNIINPYNSFNTSASYTFANDTYKITSTGSIYLMCNVVVGETYTLSYKNNNGFASIRANNYNYGGSWIEYGRSTTTDGKITFTATTDTVIIGFINGTANSSTVQQVQLEKGATATGYDEYCETSISIKNSDGIFQEVDINKTNYSTGEQLIGTWIDGKPLYRKTFKLTSPSQTSSSGTILTLDGNCSIVKYEGFLDTDNNARYPLNCWFSSDDYIYSYILPDGLKLKVAHTSYTSRPIVVTVWYTKS